MIRNVVIHIANEQPLLADLYDMPTSSDVSLVCTNIRMLDGKKPVFVDHSGSVFVFPYQTIRFLELMAGSTGMTGDVEELVPLGANGPDGNRSAVNGTAASEVDEADAEGEADLELDEDFLRRIREV